MIFERKKGFIADKIRTQLWRYMIFSDAYAIIFINIFKPLEQSAGWESRQNHKHEIWRSGLMEYYDLECPTAAGLLWCSILKRFSVPLAQSTGLFLSAILCAPTWQVMLPTARVLCTLNNCSFEYELLSLPARANQKLPSGNTTTDEPNKGMGGM